MENNTTIEVQKLGFENGHIILNVSKIWVTLERGGRGNKTTAGITAEMPADRALPIAVPYAEGEQPDNTLTLDEIKLTIEKLIEYAEMALVKDE